MEKMSKNELFQIVDEAIEKNKAIVSLGQQVGGLQYESRRHGVLLEDLHAKMDKVLEVVAPWIKKCEVIEPLLEASTKHTDQIDLTQRAVHKHVTDKTIHLNPVTQ